MGTSEYLRRTEDRFSSQPDTSVWVLVCFVAFLLLRYLWVQNVVRAKT